MEKLFKMSQSQQNPQNSSTAQNKTNPLSSLNVNFFQKNKSENTTQSNSKESSPTIASKYDKVQNKNKHINSLGDKNRSWCSPNRLERHLFDIEEKELCELEIEEDIPHEKNHEILQIIPAQ